MDGNGRWAQKRRHQRIFGHVRGAKRAKEIIEESRNLGVEALTLFAFSTENWQRPEMEVDFLMKLFLRYLKEQLKNSDTHNLRFHAIGQVEMLPTSVRSEIEKAENRTRGNTGMILNLAVSYGSKQELVQAMKKCCAEVVAGKTSLDSFSEVSIEKNLFTANCPPLDLLIRTGGDYRISNFLLWQAAYAELCFIEKCWPDFEIADFRNAIHAYAERERRFGKVLQHEPRT